MSPAEQPTQPDRSDLPPEGITLRPGEEQFLLAVALEEEDGLYGRALLMYEIAIRRNCTGVTEPDSVDRGLVAVAREKLIEGYGGIAEQKLQEGKLVPAAIARGHAARYTLPVSSEQWGLGLSEENLQRLEESLRAEIK